jgi:hypothetical protein
VSGEGVDLVTAVDVERLRKLLDDATPGPWVPDHRHCDCGEGDDEASGLGWEWKWEGGRSLGPAEPELRGLFAKWADVALIAAARSDLPELLDEIERLRDELARQRDLVDLLQVQIRGERAQHFAATQREAGLLADLRRRASVVGQPTAAAADYLCADLLARHGFTT